MRLTPIALSVALALATMASAGHGQKPQVQVNPRSVALAQQGDALAAQGQHNGAIDLYETALAVDPSNRAAFVGIARVAQAQKLPGKAIRFYAEALRLEPNDLNALAGQGEAFVQRGAVERAKQNLDRVRALCNNACPQAGLLAAAIAKGPPVEVLTARTPEAGAPKTEN
ncbi:MAG TPA: tetratricopeptide repeat protein [Allosphingosinicella sp.]|nr:tetratricopeptide repeat protein [Allosphingosinicella sp.]